MKKKVLLGAVLLGWCGLGSATAASVQTVNLQQAVQLSLQADPRIKEQEMVVEQARALLREAQANAGVHLEGNAFLGLAPAVSGGFYEGGTYSGGTPRSDSYHFHGLSDWEQVQFAIVTPLYTFGKIKYYSAAAQGNIDVKRADVRIARSNTVLDVKKAYYGYLAARDTRALLEDLQAKATDALKTVQGSLKEDKGNATQSDLYALQAGQAMLSKYLAQARAIEQVSLDGLKVLTGVGLKGTLAVADDNLQMVPLPATPLAVYQAKALSDRPEMAQLDAGMRARQALVAAKRADAYPNVYAGVVGMAANASRRNSLNNPYVYDPFNSVGITPVIGIKWDVTPGVASARQSEAEAELDALVQKNRLAQMGIPFEVAQNYAEMQADYKAATDLAGGTQAARRWMVAAFADYTAGLGKTSDLAEAFKTYALTATEYYKTMFDYDMAVARMDKLTGAHY